jgi:hypothetical protein
VLHLKKSTKDYKVRQNGRKIPNGAENLCFRIFALKGTIFARFQNPFLHSKRGSGNQNGRLVQDGLIFWEKIDFSLSGSAHRKLGLF